MPDFLFQSAVVKTPVLGIGSSVGKAFRLERAEADLKGTTRRPMRLHLSGRSGASGEGEEARSTVEMSRGEACAFSEWLDAVVTQSPAKAHAGRGSKNREKKK